MHRAERLFQLVLLLRRNRITTAQELARELQVSQRTIYRDVQSLVLSGIPVEGEPGVGYVLRQKMDLPPLMFTVEEAKALVLGARMVQAWGDPALEQAARRVLNKVRDVAPDSIRKEMDENTLFVPGFHVDPSLRATLSSIREAVEGTRKVRYAYTRYDGTNSTRTVHPLGLFYWGNKWSLGAWCELRKDFRSFRLDRMSKVRVLSTSFTPRTGKDLDSFLAAVDST
ncbi:MAG: YafY family transcriptional regulator [Candidatus Hydrogenedentes bacterium]|nr:YafY family transcriptional regulator [Candidatus Hydrogenedentota bacterium]